MVTSFRKQLGIIISVDVTSQQRSKLIYEIFIS